MYEPKLLYKALVTALHTCKGTKQTAFVAVIGAGGTFPSFSELF